MEIRGDFKPVEELLQRALLYSRQCREFNSQDWVHLRNREDFDSIYQLADARKRAFEKLYVRGRQFAADLGSTLCDFNYVGDYPTFKSFVDEVERYVEEDMPGLVEAIADAERELKHVPQGLFSVTEMVGVTRRQLGIGAALASWAQTARTTPLYCQEAGTSGIDERGERRRSWKQFASDHIVQIVVGVVASVVAGLILTALP